MHQIPFTILTNRQLKLTCAGTTAFFFTTHAYRYLSTAFSGDAMLLSQSSETAYQVSLGRFLQPVYWQIRGEITAPLLIGLFAAVFLIGAACLIVKLLELRRPLHIVLCCGVLASCETLSISNATYLPWTDIYMLALFLSVFGVYAFFHFRFGFLISAVLYALSAGLYQSYLPSAPTLVILVLMLKTLHGAHFIRIWKTGLLACLTLLLGLLLYALMLQIALHTAGVAASQDYNGVGRVSLISAQELPALLRSTYITPFRVLLASADEPAMTWHISFVPAWLNASILLLTALLLLRHVRALSPGSAFTLLFLLIMLPLAMNFIQFLSKGIVSGLTIFAYQFFYILPIALLAFESPSLSLRTLYARISCILCRIGAFTIILLLCLNIRSAQQMYTKRDLEFSSTLSAITRILDRAEQTQGYIPGETPVVLMGMLPSSSLSMERPGFEQLAKVQGMRYTYAASYETSTYWYLQMAIGEPINLVSHEERKALSVSNAAQNLPAFPQKGCCQMIDGCLYLRIS